MVAVPAVILAVAYTLIRIPTGDLAAQAPPPQKVVFALNWFPVGDHAAYWVALEADTYLETWARAMVRH
jgi:NitT/TauT family transport system substrate-binding protein